MKEICKTFSSRLLLLLLLLLWWWMYYSCCCFALNMLTDRNMKSPHCGQEAGWTNWWSDTCLILWSTTNIYFTEIWTSTSFTISVSEIISLDKIVKLSRQQFRPWTDCTDMQDKLGSLPVTMLSHYRCQHWRVLTHSRVQALEQTSTVRNTVSCSRK